MVNTNISMIISIYPQLAHVFHSVYPNTSLEILNTICQSQVNQMPYLKNVNTIIFQIRTIV